MYQVEQQAQDQQMQLDSCDFRVSVTLVLLFRCMYETILDIGCNTTTTATTTLVAKQHVM